ncbi:hypothetical protein TSUD_322170 [Trifolium subterraneum]|uniref:Uncharacterized protein n=1 Tax=Trifolium subterraneum TaxID=3900 RepID=A0A2Z6N4P8_TRISU|nr:hypothetical protein TSUD_322170 [Trifolium subterraneum]
MATVHFIQRATSSPLGKFFYFLGGYVGQINLLQIRSSPVTPSLDLLQIHLLQISPNTPSPDLLFSMYALLQGTTFNPHSLFFQMKIKVQNFDVEDVECIPATQLDEFVSHLIVSPFDLADSKSDDRPGSYVKRSLSHVFDKVVTFEACKPLKTVKIEKE